jgi:hypothetical protein
MPGRRRDDRDTARKRIPARPEARATEAINANEEDPKTAVPLELPRQLPNVSVLHFAELLSMRARAFQQRVERVAMSPRSRAR